MRNLRGIRSFVLRAGRMTKAQQSAFTRLSSSFVFSFDKGMFDKNITDKNISDKSENISSENAVLFIENAKKSGCRIIAEIGFGNGEAAALMAERDRKSIYLGIEVYLPGVGNLLKLIEEKNLENIRIINHDAVEVLDCLPGRLILDGIHIFFPDPWQKKKHNKRRIINTDFTLKLASALAPGGYIYAVTDWADYGRQMQEIFRACSLLYSPYKDFASREDGNSMLPWRPETSFERKGLKKSHKVYESFFIKK